MPIDVTMPRLSDTMQQGTIVKWNVKEGQKVKSGDVIADIETDKATMELQSFDDGTVATIGVAQGQSVPVGTVIMTLAMAGEDASATKGSGASPAQPIAKGSAAAPASAPARPSAPPAPAGTSSSRTPEPVRAQAVGTPAREGPATGPATVPARPPAAAAGAPTPGRSVPTPNGHHQPGERVFASPLARKIATEAGLDLAGLQGSGPGGRIIRKDVEAAIAAPATDRVPGRGEGNAPVAKGATPAPLPASGATLEGRVVALSSMRRIIATRLVESKQTIPHYTVTVEADMDPLLTLRESLNDQLASQGVKLSVNDFLVRACALAMHQHPFVNSRWVATPGQEAIELLPRVNVGIAIALPQERGGGLVVATVRDADQIGLRAISQQSKALSEKARTKGLAPQEMSDSTFTISNLGMFGVSHFTAIINPPNVAILAVGAAMQRPVVRDAKVVAGRVMSMTLSSDHRVVDGAMAAQYLATVRQLLEKPAALLV